MAVRQAQASGSGAAGGLSRLLEAEARLEASILGQEAAAAGLVAAARQAAAERQALLAEELAGMVADHARRLEEATVAELAAIERRATDRLELLESIPVATRARAVHGVVETILDELAGGGAA